MKCQISVLVGTATNVVSGINHFLIFVKFSLSNTTVKRRLCGIFTPVFVKIARCELIFYSSTPVAVLSNYFMGDAGGIEKYRPTEEGL